MTINRELWLARFKKDSIPEWNCPRCKKGLLQPIENGFLYNETGDTLAGKKKYEWLEPESDKYRYSLFLRCGNENCREIVVSCGDGFFVEEYTSWVEEIQQYAPEPVLVFEPKYFYPFLSIFFLPDICPDSVLNQIEASFNLFFADPSASANCVRKAVEEILTERGVKKSTVNKKGKPIFITLDDRIKKFKEIQPEFADKLLALKWLGNEGSHSDTIMKTDLLDAYEILEIVLDDIYVGYRKSVDEKVSKINNRKKPLYPST